MPARIQWAAFLDAIVSQLKTRSETRVAGDKDFSQINKLIEKYLQRQNDKTISLNEGVLRAEEEEMKQEKKEEEGTEKEDNEEEKEEVI